MRTILQGFVLRSVGFDHDVARLLNAGVRHDLVIASCGMLFVSVALAGAGGYAGYLVHPTPASFVCGALGFGALVLNLFRLGNAGGGVSVRHSLGATRAACERFTPSWVPVGVVLVLAMLLAQPLQLVVASKTLSEEVERHRVELMAQHTLAQTALGRGGDHVNAELEQAKFPVFAIRALWRTPANAATWTLVFAIVVVSPLLWSRWAAIRSLRAYQLERAVRTFRGMQRSGQHSAQLAQTYVDAWRSRVEKRSAG